MALLTGGHHNRLNVVIYNAEVHSHRHAYRLEEGKLSTYRVHYSSHNRPSYCDGTFCFTHRKPTAAISNVSVVPTAAFQVRWTELHNILMSVTSKQIISSKKKFPWNWAKCFCMPQKQRTTTLNQTASQRSSRGTRFSLILSCMWVRRKHKSVAAIFSVLPYTK
jgi:hypothetical protein